MVRSLSMDLRLRVAALMDSGVSCRQAAARFGVSPSTAIRWRQLVLSQGDVLPKTQGGDRRSGRIEAHAGLILSALDEKPDITLAELQALLAERGIGVGIGTLWRFFDRRQITLKKRRPTLRSKIVPTS